MSKAQSEITGLTLITIIIILAISLVGSQILTNQDENPDTRVEIREPTQDKITVQIIEMGQAQKIYLENKTTQNKIPNTEITKQGQVITTKERNFRIIAIDEKEEEETTIQIVNR